jgi:hypothetical protein
MKQFLLSAQPMAENEEYRHTGSEGLHHTDGSQYNLNDHAVSLILWLIPKNTFVTELSLLLPTMIIDVIKLLMKYMILIRMTGMQKVTGAIGQKDTVIVLEGLLKPSNLSCLLIKDQLQCQE